MNSTINKLIGLFILLASFSGQVSIHAQQIGYNSHFTEVQSFWNPAATAPETDFEATAFFRQQWLGFNSAPKTGFASAAYPFLDYNMSLGGILHLDNTGPVTKTGITVNYAYKLKEILGDEDQLSIGLGGTFSQYRFSDSDLIFNDKTDILIANSNNSTLFPSVSAGIFYTRNGRRDEDRTFWTSFSMQQLISGKVEILDASAQRQNQYHFGIGARKYGYDSYIEPYLYANITQPEIVDIIVGARYEVEEKFWAGLGFSTVNDLSIQGGWIIPEISGRYTSLRIGAIGNIAMSSAAGDFGPGFEIVIAYKYDMD